MAAIQSTPLFQQVRLNSVDFSNAALQILILLRRKRFLEFINIMNERHCMQLPRAFAKCYRI